MTQQPEEPPEDREAGRLHRIRELLAEDLDVGFDLLVNSYSSLVYSLALRLTGSNAEADDLSQETFLRAYTALRRFPPERRRELKPGPWLATIGTNLWRNRVRDRLRRAPSTPVSYDDERHDSVGAEPGPEQSAIARDGWDRLAALVVRLPDHYRAAVVLRHVIGLSYEEMSQTLRCPIGTAKAQTSRALAILRTMLGEQVPGDELVHR